MASVKTPIPAVATYIAGMSTHCAVFANIGSQFAAIGLQAKTRLRKIAIDEPTQKNIVTHTKIRYVLNGESLL